MSMTQPPRRPLLAIGQVGQGIGASESANARALSGNALRSQRSRANLWQMSTAAAGTSAVGRRGEREATAKVALHFRTRLCLPLAKALPKTLYLTASLAAQG